MLEVRLIGTFAIKCDGEPVTLSSRAAQSLFAYLILTGGTIHRREKLAGMFWPDATEEKARARLRHELWRIRKTLLTISKSEYFLTDDLTIGFNQSTAYWLDVTALKNVGDHATTDELISSLLFHQSELLPGFYEDWVLLERQHLQVVFEHKIAQLLALLESEKRWPEILEWAERWISLGQVPETAYQALMSAYDALGDRDKVVSTYQRCAMALAELGLEPSEEIRALAEKGASKLNIPIPLTSFVGREQELNEVAHILSRHRLVTLTGSGGVGKTRLAIQVVPDVLGLFPDGVWFLDLAPLTDPELLPNILANLLGLRESGETKLTLTELLVNFFRSRTVLIIFDNCEHLIEACAQLVNSLLTSCENLSVLATSREALRVSGEVPYRVPSLEVPAISAEEMIHVIANASSVKLFVERAAAVSPGFTINLNNALYITQTCQRLDGIPLAIELAAARMDMLTAEQIAKRLDDRFNLLTRGLRSAMPRHQTLRATIEWSYNLLSPQERILFRRLAGFMGGWTLEAAEAVCSGDEIESSEVLDLLSQLVNKSLVLVETVGDETRYRRLETIRKYAIEILNKSDEMNTICLRHLKFFAEMVDKAERNFKGPGEALWYERLDRELDNLRRALTWIEGIEYAEMRLRFAAGLWRYWKNRGNSSEGHGHLMRVLKNVSPGPARQTPAYARALTAAGSLAYYEGDFPFSEQSRKEALAIFRKLHDQVGIADCLNGLGNTAISQGNYVSARAFYEESLIIRKELRDKWGVARLLGNLGLLAFFQADYIRARSLHLESLALFRELRDDESIANELVNLGDVERIQGELSNANSFYIESATISRRLNDEWGLPYAFMGMADVAFEQGNLFTAASLYRECLSMFQKAREHIGLPFALESVAALAFAKDMAETSARIFGAAEALRKSIHSPLPFPYRSTYQKNLSLLHQRLGPVEFEIAWNEGYSMTSEQTIALAMECLFK